MATQYPRLMRRGAYRNRGASHEKIAAFHQRVRRALARRAGRADQARPCRHFAERRHAVQGSRREAGRRGRVQARESVQVSRHLRLRHGRPADRAKGCGSRQGHADRGDQDRAGQEHLPRARRRHRPAQGLQLRHPFPLPGPRERPGRREWRQAWPAHAHQSRRAEIASRDADGRTPTSTASRCR